MSGSSSTVYLRNMSVKDITITVNGSSTIIDAESIEQVDAVFAAVFKDKIVVLTNFVPYTRDALYATITTPGALPGTTPKVNLDFSYKQNSIYSGLCA
jgi:hypothetical protein